MRVAAREEARVLVLRGGKAIAHMAVIIGVHLLDEQHEPIFAQAFFGQLAAECAVKILLLHGTAGTEYFIPYLVCAAIMGVLVGDDAGVVEEGKDVTHLGLGEAYVADRIKLMAAPC